MSLAYPTLEIVGDIPDEMAIRLYRELPAPKNDAEKDVMERICIQCEGGGYVDADGKLKAVAG